MMGESHLECINKLLLSGAAISKSQIQKLRTMLEEDGGFEVSLAFSNQEYFNVCEYLCLL